VTLFETINEVPVPHQIGPRRAGDIVYCYAGVEKIQQTMDWQAKLTLADALQDAWRWQQGIGKE
jgi:UDP-glucose 4-epimerase